MSYKFKIGSLFDGSGGFPLAGSLCGVEPVWASEVEPYPIAVTRERFDGRGDSPLLQIARKHFPELKLILKHLGNVCEINGAEVELVDIITFGSPCQDLSVAGKRAGLKHEANGGEETTRSGLFMEAVRIIKEMRAATNGKYPSFALWENVPGAFSSNKGDDFHVVLEELIKIVEPTAVMPPVPEGGWAYADCYCGNGWSLAYRVLDSQYIRTAQRRKRVYLVVDFAGERAGEVLFKSEGLSGHSAESGTPWQGAAGDAENCAGTADREGVVGLDFYNLAVTGDVAKTLNAAACDADHVPCVLQKDLSVTDDVRHTVRRLTPTECARLQGFGDRWGDINPKSDFSDEEYSFWLNVRNTHAEINGKATKDYTKQQMLAWYNKLHTDSAEYKMWGNGIALPPAIYCMEGIAEALQKEASQMEAINIIRSGRSRWADL